MISISNFTDYSLKEGFLKSVARTVLSGENLKGRYRLSLGFVPPSEMRRLNRLYYKKESLSDVLSFQGGVSGFPQVLENRDIGEIIICPAQVAANARAEGNSFHRELTWVLIHGLLHLLGYEHEEEEEKAKEMRAREDYYLNQLG